MCRSLKGKDRISWGELWQSGCCTSCTLVFHADINVHNPASNLWSSSSGVPTSGIHAGILMWQILVTWKHDSLGVYRQNSNKNGREEGDLRSEMWCWRVKRRGWFGSRPLEERPCTDESMHPLAASTLPPDSLTQGDNDLRLVFCVLGASIMGSFCQSNVSPLASQRSLIRDCRTFGGCGGHTLESVHCRCGGHTLLDALTTADSSLICVSVFFFLALPVGSV